jgi:hypothetical protein
MPTGIGAITVALDGYSQNVANEHAELLRGRLTKFAG